MKIYIASSWKNQHGVELLTLQLRRSGFEVISWIENNYGENPDRATADGKKFDFEEWVNSSSADQSFEFDTQGAMTCDLFIYYGNAGKDAAAECGLCYGQRLSGRTIPMIGLVSKGEDFGLMRKMFDRWFDRAEDLLNWVIKNQQVNPHACFGREPHPMDFEDAEEFQLRHYYWQQWNKKNSPKAVAHAGD